MPPFPDAHVACCLFLCLLALFLFDMNCQPTLDDNKDTWIHFLCAFLGPRGRYDLASDKAKGLPLFLLRRRIEGASKHEFFYHTLSRMPEVEMFRTHVQTCSDPTF